MERSIEQHFIWSAIRLAQTTTSDDVLHSQPSQFQTTNRFESAFGSRDDLVARIESSTGLPYRLADLCLAMVEVNIDGYSRSVDVFSLDGIVIHPTESLIPEEAFWAYRNPYLERYLQAFRHEFEETRWRRRGLESRPDYLALSLRLAGEPFVARPYEVRMYLAPDIARPPAGTEPWPIASVLTTTDQHH